MFAYLELQEKQIPSATQFTSLSLVRPSPYLRVSYFSKKKNIEHCSFHSSLYNLLYPHEVPIIITDRTLIEDLRHIN